LARILEGQKEGLADLAWHPTRPMVASVSMSGVIYLWAKDYTENWSAFAPDFKELEENEEYVEREDEFDIMPETEKVHFLVTKCINLMSDCSALAIIVNMSNMRI
jgi:COMPASS component SWD1